LELIFKDVGQGDSILLKFNDEGTGYLNIGIIDCNIKAGRNPILDELRDIKEEYTVKFLILSHPHYDHISGAYDLLVYLKESKITIEKISSSINDWSVEYIASTATNNEKKELSRLLNLIELLENDPITLVHPLMSNLNIFNIGSFKLRCLYPTKQNYRQFKNQHSHHINANGKKADPNDIASIFSIECIDWYILLTSDVYPKALFDIERRFTFIREDELKLLQVPHHGSKNNHNIQFWKKRNYKANCPSVISVGENSYNHPNINVVKEFKQENFKIYSTNNVNGIKLYFSGTVSQKADPHLNFFFPQSKTTVSKISNKRFEGDKTFLVTIPGVKYIERTE